VTCQFKSITVEIEHH